MFKKLKRVGRSTNLVELEKQEAKLYSYENFNKYEYRTENPPVTKEFMRKYDCEMKKLK